MPLNLPVWSALPFVLLLLTIAVLPLLAPHWWESNRNKAIVAAGFGVPVALYLLFHGAQARHALFHELADYGSFIVLLGALYVIAGGIVVEGDLPGRPRTNAGFLAIGAVLANIVGTTGASMLLVRPLLKSNSQRKRVAHIPVFFIFVVCNTGGLLTPLGDPPLFLGFLLGVDFFWTLRLWPEWLFVNSVLIAIFYCWDRWAYRQESPADVQRDLGRLHPLRLFGGTLNIPLLFVVIGAVIGQKFWPRPISEIVMLICAGISWLKTPASVRHANHFHWHPIGEVAILFAGIFVAMVPALALLKLHGAQAGVTEPWQFFWLTGLLSSGLDNAPTYVSIGTLAAQGNSFEWLAQNRPELLAAVSCGAVFMGANTYIGNGPNFMVKSIAESQGFKMPSFFGYAGYGAVILLPVFAVVTLIFFR